MPYVAMSDNRGSLGKMLRVVHASECMNHSQFVDIRHARGKREVHEPGKKKVKKLLCVFSHCKGTAVCYHILGLFLAAVLLASDVWLKYCRRVAVVVVGRIIHWTQTTGEIPPVFIFPEP